MKLSGKVQFGVRTPIRGPCPLVRTWTTGICLALSVFAIVTSVSCGHPESTPTPARKVPSSTGSPGRSIVTDNRPLVPRQSPPPSPTAATREPATPVSVPKAHNLPQSVLPPGFTAGLSAQKDLPLPSPSPKSYLLTLNVGSPELGTVLVDPSRPGNRHPEGSVVDVKAVPRPGNKFGGWNIDNANPASDTVTVVMNGDKALKGDFVRLLFAMNIEAIPSGAGTVTVSPPLKSFSYGDTVTFKAQPSTGHLFQSWSGDVSGDQNPLEMKVTREMKVVANFAQAEYSLKVKMEPLGFVDIDPPAGRYQGGARVTLTARTPDRYRFLSWSGDASGISPRITFVMDSNKNITANFKRVFIFTSHVEPRDGGWIEPASGIFDEGTEIKVRATARDGYEFREWTGAFSGGNDYQTLIMNWDKVVGAHFDPIRR